MRAVQLLALLPLALASPLLPRQATSSATNSTSASGPKVTFYPNSSPVVATGVSYPQSQQNVFFGIPYAKPPVGNLRFTAPQSPKWNTTQFEATKQPPACLQNQNELSAVDYYGTYGYSEDCLYLNVFAPENATSSQAKLPVMVWLYGGSFVAGAASYYNATPLISQGMENGTPIIYVALNYRLGVLGFGNGAEIAANNASNLGLRDVILGLEWVKTNIGSFGGDPSKVTVFGQSAGAIITSILYLNPNIDLFRSAIMESGAQSSAPLGPTSKVWQGPFDLLVKYTNCTGNSTTATNATTSPSMPGSAAANQSIFECLKAVPGDLLIKAQGQVQAQPQYEFGFIFGPSIDGDLIPDSPHVLLSQGKFAKHPFISGNNKDEGTEFIPSMGVNESFIPIAIDLFEPNPPNMSVIQQLLKLYPDDPSMGSPFDTGNETFGLTPEFKQLAAIVGDEAFQSTRRWFLKQANSHGLMQTWSYLFEAVTPGLPPYLGTYHSAEVPFIYGNVSTEANYTQSDVALSKQMMQYWLNFATYTDPTPRNASTSSVKLTHWPSYGSNQTLLQLNGTNLTTIPDTYRQAQMNFFNSEGTVFDT